MVALAELQRSGFQGGPAQFKHGFGPRWIHQDQSVAHSRTRLYFPLLCYEEVTVVCSCCLLTSLCSHLSQLLLDEYLRPLHL